MAGAGEMHDEARTVATEGERAIRNGETDKGIALLEEALTKVVGTTEKEVLSGIFSQLGNAYYAQKDYAKALDFHKRELDLWKKHGDRSQQAKAISNNSATYAMIGDYESSKAFANTVIEISRELNDKSLECRGLYNLGLAYLNEAVANKSKSIATVDEKTKNDLLKKSVECFLNHLSLAEASCSASPNDQFLTGLAIGNLGNAYFYLRQYHKAIEFLARRLEIARKLGDKASMRRSWTNMGNSYTFVGDFQRASECYKSALNVNIGNDRTPARAQILYNLANCEQSCGLSAQSTKHLHEYLAIAQSLGDRQQQMQAHARLADAYFKMNDRISNGNKKAIDHLKVTYNLAVELNQNDMMKNVMSEISRQLCRLRSTGNEERHILNEADKSHSLGSSIEMDTDELSALRDLRNMDGNDLELAKELNQCNTNSNVNIMLGDLEKHIVPVPLDDDEKRTSSRLSNFDLSVTKQNKSFDQLTESGNKSHSSAKKGLSSSNKGTPTKPRRLELVSFGSKRFNTDGENADLFDQVFRLQSKSYNDQRAELCLSGPRPLTSTDDLRGSSIKGKKSTLSRAKNSLSQIIPRKYTTKPRPEIARLTSSAGRSQTYSSPSKKSEGGRSGTSAGTKSSSNSIFGLGRLKKLRRRKSNPKRRNNDLRRTTSATATGTTSNYEFNDDADAEGFSLTSSRDNLSYGSGLTGLNSNSESYKVIEFEDCETDTLQSDKTDKE